MPESGSESCAYFTVILCTERKCLSLLFTFHVNNFHNCRELVTASHAHHYARMHLLSLCYVTASYIPVPGCFYCQCVMGLLPTSIFQAASIVSVSRDCFPHHSARLLLLSMCHEAASYFIVIITLL